jgi:hypothetical protein
MSFHNLCVSWDEKACDAKNVKFQKKGDFYVVTGSVTNRLDCTLPQLRININFLDARGKKINVGVLGRKFNGLGANGDVLHFSDRALIPGENYPFKLEGLWEPALETVHSIKVAVRPQAK